MLFLFVMQAAIQIRKVTVDFGLDKRAGHVARMPMSRAPRAVTDWLGIAFSTDWLSTDDLGQDVGERAQK
jgi:hypothetical protein